MLKGPKKAKRRRNKQCWGRKHDESCFEAWVIEAQPPYPGSFKTAQAVENAGKARSRVCSTISGKIKKGNDGNGWIWGSMGTVMISLSQVHKLFCLYFSHILTSGSFG